MNNFQYKCSKGLLTGVGKIPLPVLYTISNILYGLNTSVIHYREKVVDENLLNVFPEKTEKERKEIQKKFYRYFFDLAVETVAELGMSAEKIANRTKYVNADIIDNYYQQGRNVVAVLPHYCNWEWGCCYSLYGKHKTLIAYKPMSNKIFDRIFYEKRARYGSLPVPMNKTARSAIAHSKEEPVILFLVADQTPASNPNAFHYTTFLGIDGTPVFLGPEKISKMLDAVYVYTDLKRVKKGYYEIEFKVLCESPKEVPAYELTEMYLRQMEAIIHENPEYWLWSHRRWKRRKIQVEENVENELDCIMKQAEAEANIAKSTISNSVI